jgi:NADH dehydrogenase FAD-containing subunit
MVGQRRPSQITKDLRRMVHAGVEVLRAEAHEIEAEGGRVRAGEQEITSDYVAIALGADLAPTALPGSTLETRYEDIYAIPSTL